MFATSSQRGVNDSYSRIKGVMSRGEAEVEEMVLFFQQLSKATSEYAKALGAIRERFRNPTLRLGDYSHGYVLSTCWTKFRDSAGILHKEHNNFAATIDSLVLPSLEDFRVEQRTHMIRIRGNIKQKRADYEDTLDRMTRAKGNYDNKTQAHHFQQNQVNRELMVQDRADVANRTYKSKEDMEKADAIYRDAIVRVEDARTDLENTVNHGIKELEDLERRRFHRVTDAFRNYTSTVGSLAEKATAVSKEFQANIEILDESGRSDVDVRNYVLELQQAWTAPEKVQYVKDGAAVKDMVFGVELDRAAHGRNPCVPLIVEKCIRAVEARGLDKEGIYRVPASVSSLASLRAKIESNENIDLEKPGTDVPEAEDVNAVAGLLKMYLRELPTPMVNVSEKERQDYARLGEAARLAKLREYMRHMTRAQRHTFKAVIGHMQRVAENTNQNRMSAHSVATVFSPVIFRSPNTHQPSQSNIIPQLLPQLQKQKPADAALVAELFKADTALLEDVMRFGADVFGGPGPEAQFPPRGSSLKPVPDLPQSFSAGEVLTASTAGPYPSSAAGSLANLSGGQSIPRSPVSLQSGGLSTSGSSLPENLEGITVGTLVAKNSSGSGSAASSDNSLAMSAGSPGSEPHGSAVQSSPARFLSLPRAHSSSAGSPGGSNSGGDGGTSAK